MMKLGLGLYYHMLTADNYRFARQAGATHIVAHLVDYFSSGPRFEAVSDAGWGQASGDVERWTVDRLKRLRAAVNAEGLELEAIENFDPVHWYDILLDGPRKHAQMDHLKQIIRAMGEAGIPVMGYNFSIAGVWGWATGPFARGGAESVGFTGVAEETPIPNGMVWNMTYQADAPHGTIGTLTSEQLWSRLAWFLEQLVPVAEEAGVRLAAHPDDPPMPTLRGTARLVYQPHHYHKLLDLVPSHANALELCVGSIAEMSEGDVYDAVEAYSRERAIGYLHFRNVRGKIPHYHEVFVDEGDIDMLRVMHILHETGYDGVLIPDHTPQMTCPGPWHAGMAYALGYMRAAMQMMEQTA